MFTPVSEERTKMKIVITILILIALLDYALLVASSRAEDRETYEAYERWKNGRSDKEK